MKTVYATLAVTFALTLVACAAFAADAPKDIKATVMGKVEVKTEKVANTDTKVPYIVVSEAKGMDGKILADLKGKTLKVIGLKVADVVKLAGKEVTMMGTIKGNEINATMVAEKKAPVPAPAAAPAPAPAPAPAAAPAPAPAPAPAK